MTDSQKSTDFNSKYINRQAFEKLRRGRQLFDFKIIAGDKEFDVHKLIIAIESDYFKAMLTHDSKEAREGKVRLQDIDPDVLEAILNFCYTGDIELTSDNVDDILLGASMLQIRGILDMCANFVRESLDTTNCLGVFVLSERFKLKNLASFALTYCLNNFRKVVRESEFVEMDVNTLKQLISDDNLNVDEELEVMEAIKNWVEADRADRTKHLFDLMKLVRIVHIDPLYLVNLNSYEPIRNSEDCRNLIDLAKSYLILKNHPQEQAIVKEKLSTAFRSSFKRQRLYAVGGWTDQYRSIASAEVYNPLKNCWNSISPMTQKRCGVGLVTFGDSIYAIGGHDGINYLKSVERYDVSREVWLKDVDDMKYERTSVCVATLSGHIYAIGGQVNNGALDRVERYDLSTRTWSECEPLNEKRFGAGVAVYQGHIYIMGGSNGKQISSSVEMYSPDTGTWTFIKSMQRPRKHMGSCSYNGRIYVVGGRSNSSELAEGEAYNPATDTWTAIKPMPSSRCGLGLVALAGKLFAVGGSNEDIRLSLVESYDPETDTWSTQEPMTACRIAGGVAVHPAS